MLGTCAQPVSSQIYEQYFAFFLFIKVQEFATTTAANGNKSIQLIHVENSKPLRNERINVQESGRCW